MLDLITLLQHDLGLIKYSRSGTYYFQIRSCLETQGLGLQRTILAGSNSNRLKQVMLLTHHVKPPGRLETGMSLVLRPQGSDGRGEGQGRPSSGPGVSSVSGCLV